MVIGIGKYFIIEYKIILFKSLWYIGYFSLNSFKHIEQNAYMYIKIIMFMAKWYLQQQEAGGTDHNINFVHLSETLR